MPINADKPHLWKADTRASVDRFNQWFMKFAPKAYRDTRKKTIEDVEKGLTLTKDLLALTSEVLKANPSILPTLRMSTCPPLARDRLIGLADSTKNLVNCLEEGKVPPQMDAAHLEAHLKSIKRSQKNLRRSPRTKSSTASTDTSASSGRGSYSLK